MELISSHECHFAELVSWIHNEQQLRQWAGPQLRYPIDAQSLGVDLECSSRPSFALISTDGSLLGFGQVYLRQERCHLCRLIVAPTQRGRGIAGVLVDEICRQGSIELGVGAYSLFVYHENKAAISAYKKYGFSITPYVGSDAIDNCVYMTKN